MNQKIDNKKVLEQGAIKASLIKDRLILRSLKRLCEDAIKVAIDEHNFDNQSDNLEESYGYAIYHNGLMADQMIEGASDGADNSAEFLGSYSPRRSWECVVIAGASYASNLEGYIRRTNGERSQAGDMLRVLNDSFNFVVLESRSYFK